MAVGQSFDATVVGAGPNGLAAAVTLAEAGLSVIVREAANEIGGGSRSSTLTIPGFVHDVCAAVHPFGVASPFFRRLPLAEHGLHWIHPPAPLAHPLDDGTAVMMERSVGETAAGLGADGDAWFELFEPLAARWEMLVDQVLAPAIPRHPLVLAMLARHGLLPARRLAERHFRGKAARALFAGLAAHSVMPLEAPFSAAFGLLLGMAGHSVGWPMAQGGSGALGVALGSYLASIGGRISTSDPVTSIDAVLSSSRLAICDLTPRQLLDVAGHRFTPSYRRALSRFRYGPAAFKIDWSLSSPIPWTAPECLRAGTVHLGGDMDEIAQSERNAWEGRESALPFVLLVQPSLFDQTRAPLGSHTAWAYCHVPNGSQFDMVEAVESQVERYAPGFRDCIVARSAMGPAELEQRNANLVGGDFSGGANTPVQLLLRPTIRAWRTSHDRVFICSASTPPGGGVHGMCGHLAAMSALGRRRFGLLGI
jgi:phytoene dehydrogenase-like protein